MDAARTIFFDEAPGMAVRGGMVFLTIRGESQPGAAVPVHVMQRFCIGAMQAIEAWQQEQMGSVQSFTKRRAGKHG